ncbi:hypothetical protein D7B24_009600 [Verticillium nonalfalfae]|uniref:Ferroxidase fet3 n=1 Tax=Verticillium nonalfalfae TaxID=1051616 RepID=A0A3M9Y389_9PEZI|nr:uncharacterized protein D7B24_009600 [Verticillium nonalfalfae]RNJ54585.1 hypothetical protein D7B24_009600 [Verticillium nonalfalfae]
MLFSRFLALATAGVGTIASAKVVTYKWTVDWVTAAPDGFSRSVIGIDGQWPCPTIEASVGDTVVVELTNNLGNQTTGIHFHGINQVSTNFMDGPSMVTQCPLPPGSTMKYQFEADVGGTYWYHSHNMGQYPDGLRGPMIIHDPNDPYVGQYDEEYILTLSDWYHEETINLVRAMLSPNNTQHRPPLPQAVLVNDGAGSHYPFAKGKTYRFRIISFAAFAGFMLHFDSHDMNVIMNDGAYVKKKLTYQLRVATAQRYDILVSCIDRDNRNYPFLVALDQNPDHTNADLPQSWPLNHTGQLIMFPEKPLREDVVNKWRPSDDSHFESPDGPNSILPSPDQTIVIDFTTCFDSNGIPRSCINQKPYIEQKVPTLYTAVTTGEFNTDPAVYGQVNPFIVSAGSIVDIVVNNHDVAIHPFHLHGHHFQILRRPSSGTGDWPGAKRARLNSNPPYRDTVSVMGNSHTVLRYKADNPGVYLFHCHIEWHVEMGLTATIIEAPDVLRDMSIPQDHLEICKSEGIPTSGNAGGNSENPLDTSNFNSVPPLVYNGALWPIPGQTRPLVKAVRSARVRTRA